MANKTKTKKTEMSEEEMEEAVERAAERNRRQTSNSYKLSFHEEK